jgi:hypothetical protein
MKHQNTGSDNGEKGSGYVSHPVERMAFDAKYYRRRFSIMNRTCVLPLTLATGLLGGVLSRYVTPAPAFAQAQTQKEVKAQSFVLVDDKDNIVGTFKPSADRIPTVVLMDRTGREIWRAGVSAKVLSER